MAGEDNGLPGKIGAGNGRKNIVGGKLRIGLPHLQQDSLRLVPDQVDGVGGGDDEGGQPSELQELIRQVPGVGAALGEVFIILAHDHENCPSLHLTQALVALDLQLIHDDRRVGQVGFAGEVLLLGLARVVELQFLAALGQGRGPAIGNDGNLPVKGSGHPHGAPFQPEGGNLEGHQTALASGSPNLLQENIGGPQLRLRSAGAGKAELFHQGILIITFVHSQYAPSISI